MARTKFKNITIEYAGQDLLDGGMFAEVQGALNGSTRYTTQAVAHLGAAAVALDECGNLSREGSLSVAVDYDSEADMLADVIAREGFADAHQRAVLRVCAREAAAARVELTPLEGYVAGQPYYLDVEFDPTRPPWNFDWTPAEGEASAQGFANALNDAGNWPNLQGELPFRAELAGGKVVLVMLAAGAGGNGFQVQLYDHCPVQEMGDINFSGGADEVAQVYDAALTDFSYTSDVAGKGLRVVYRYAFILGGSAE